MKKIAHLLIVLTFFIGQSQSNVQITNTVRNYKEIHTSEELYHRLDRDFTSNYSKVKAAYTWITLHIRYQVSNSKFIHEPEEIVYFNEEDLARKLKEKNDRLVETAIKDKAGVCEHMALTLKKICDYLNIENELIKGYVRNSPEEIGIKPKYKNHVWNAVKLQGRWMLVDATYGIDYNRVLDRPECNFSYFDIPKDLMKLTHYPSDKKWIDFLEQSHLNQFSSLPMFWDSFIKTKAVLVAPINGELDNSDRKKFITFKDLDESLTITYKFKDEVFAKKPLVKRTKNYTNVIIDSEDEGILTLYFNGKSALAFKVEK